jgi:hypothetical protein
MIAELIQRLDFNRGHEGRSFRGPGHKEWLHFSLTGAVDMVVNFSLIEDASSGARTARLITLVRREGWRGSVEAYEADEVSFRGGRLGARFGGSHVRFSRGRYELLVAPRELPLRAELTLAPVTMPAPIYNVPVDDGPALNWSVVPHLRATGRVTLGETVHRIEDAPTYHDHNWGTFRWGTNFAWEWGHALPRDPTNPWAMVSVRLTDRARTSARSQGLFVWHGARQARIFAGRDIVVRREGFLRSEGMLKLPAVMRLLHPGSGSDVPARYILEARDAGDRLTCHFEPRDVAQLIVPDEEGFGLTVVNEVAGAFQAEGMLAGKRLSSEGEAIFEFLSH